jgi:hypothetical protein
LPCIVLPALEISQLGSAVSVVEAQCVRTRDSVLHFDIFHILATTNQLLQSGVSFPSSHPISRLPFPLHLHQYIILSTASNQDVFMSQASGCDRLFSRKQQTVHIRFYGGIVFEHNHSLPLSEHCIIPHFVIFGLGVSPPTLCLVALTTPFFTPTPAPTPTPADMGDRPANMGLIPPTTVALLFLLFGHPSG